MILLLLHKIPNKDDWWNLEIGDLEQIIFSIIPKLIQRMYDVMM